jgi:putative addiction module antidote
MVTLTIRKVGNSMGIILPQELLTTLNVSEGDKLTFVQAPDGMRVTPFNPDFERQMALAEKGIKMYRNALRELAK